MKLTASDIMALKEMGYGADVAEIQRAKILFTSDDGKRIEKQDAIDLISYEQFLSGLDRATFHRTAYREKDGVGIMFERILPRTAHN